MWSGFRIRSRLYLTIYGGVSQLANVHTIGFDISKSSKFFKKFKLIIVIIIILLRCTSDPEQWRLISQQKLQVDSAQRL